MILSEILLASLAKFKNEIFLEFQYTVLIVALRQ